APVFASGPTEPGHPQENLTDGNLSTFSHNVDVQPAFAYQVRLTQAVAFTRLEIFNRDDGCCPERLNNYRVSVHSDNAGAIGPAVWSAELRRDNSNSGVGGKDVLLPELDPGAPFEGQWIQIQNLDLGVDRYLQIAEVRAFGLGGSSGYGALVRRDVTAEMKNVNSSAWVRAPFLATNLASVDQLTLRVRYDDGFVAWINGVEVGRANAPPDPLFYNARATAAHYASSAQEFDVPISLLHEGTNLLACRGLNLDAGDRDFLLFPELIARSSAAGAYGYLLNPTPRGVNGSNTLAGFVEDPRFSIDRGFFDKPIDIIITSPTPGATLVYTTNLANPTLTNGVLRVPVDADSSISATVRVTTTTILRA
ncbi:MAG TPA: hypothetical protein VNM37_02650, partial [Candidatus Dormibacteraeota bacterium]|nr:hypothetical protein [Candidatus Dormibacteraeota bacterium]